jgi:hypothetical protein
MAGREVPSDLAYDGGAIDYSRTVNGTGPHGLGKGFCLLFAVAWEHVAVQVGGRANAGMAESSRDREKALLMAQQDAGMKVAEVVQLHMREAAPLREALKGAGYSHWIYWAAQSIGEHKTLVIVSALSLKLLQHLSTFVRP